MKGCLSYLDNWAKAYHTVTEKPMPLLYEEVNHFIPKDKKLRI